MSIVSFHYLLYRPREFPFRRVLHLIIFGIARASLAPYQILFRASRGTTFRLLFIAVIGIYID
jgi:hypothetical protein